MESKELVILEEKDQEVVSKMSKIFDGMMTAHSEFQIRNFILNDIDFPTDSGKFHQSVRELYGRYQNLISTTYEYKKITVELEIDQIRKEQIQSQIVNDFNNKLDQFDVRGLRAQMKLCDIEIDNKLLRLESIKKSASETIREMKIFIDVVEKLDRIIPDELRNEDGLPDKEKSEPDFWFSRQMICEALNKDPNRTPFSRIMGLKPNEPVQIMRDYLDRMVIVSPEDAKLIEEQRVKMQLEQSNRKLLGESRDGK